MQAQVTAWGNSQGVRISKNALRAANISLNEYLDMDIGDGVITLMKKYRHRTLEERAAQYGGKLNLCEEFDWGDPVGREVW